MGRIASRVLLTGSGVMLVAAVLAFYAGAAILDREGFADRGVSALAQDEVDEEIAKRFTDGVVERSPGLVTLRPALEAAAADVAAGPWFKGRFGAGMRAFHRDVFDASEPRPALRVPDMAAQVRAAVAARTPVLATRLPRDANPALLSVGGSGPERALLRGARRADAAAAVAPVLLVLGLLGLVAGALVAPDRRRGLWGAGVTLAAAGGVLTAGWIGARTLTLEGFDTSWGDAVVTSIWGAYLGDLRVWSLGLAGTGIIVAAAVARPGGERWGRAPGGVRAAAALLAGGLLLADRDVALDLAAAGAAGLLLYLGTERLLAARAGLAVPALAGVAVVVVVASGGPAHAPPLTAVTTSAGAATAAPSQPAAGRRQAKGEPPPAGPQVCFASMQDARAAAETAAIPVGATVRRLADGRVCVRAR